MDITAIICLMCNYVDNTYMDGTTGIVLTVIFGLVALILGILNYATKNKENENKKIIKQTELEVKLANIKKDNGKRCENKSRPSYRNNRNGKQ